jgi:hypothetical protein
VEDTQPSPVHGRAEQGRVRPGQSHRSPPAFTAPQAGSVEGLAVEGRACMSFCVCVCVRNADSRLILGVATAIAINGP